MSARPGTVRRDLFTESYAQNAHAIAKGATLLHGFAAGAAPSLLQAIEDVVAAAPLRHMITPGGYRMSVAMTNCGAADWVTDRSGYRYDARDPLTGKPWPAMPDIFGDLARRAAAAGGFGDFEPDACLINRYEGEATPVRRDDRGLAGYEDHLLRG